MLIDIKILAKVLKTYTKLVKMKSFVKEAQKEWDFNV